MQKSGFLIARLIYFSMMDKQLNAIKKYCKECVLRGILDCLLGLCDIAMIPYYVHSLFQNILTKVRYEKCSAIVCIVAFLFLEQIKAWNRII